MSHLTLPSAPLFRDPMHDGAADPTVIWNRGEQSWWLLYTNRRANIDCPGVAWCHGTDIGIASSIDGGRTWVYRGTVQGLEYKQGRNTYWAPEVIWCNGTYHMFVSFVPGVPVAWSGSRYILHYTSVNLWDWTFQSRLSLSSERVIDACVSQMPSGKWRMWYKDEGNHSHTYAADSDDLYEWSVVGPVITDCVHEGPNVFEWKGRYWMITDPWNGLGVYYSKDLEHWIRQRNILGEPGSRLEDGVKGGHADVLVQDDDALIFYFTHPERNQNYYDLEFNQSNVEPYKYRRTSIQVAKLELEDDQLVCHRDKSFDFLLKSQS